MCFSLKTTIRPPPVYLNSNLIAILNPNIYVTNQTTLSKYELKDIYDTLSKKYPNSIIDNKICDATTLRQEAVMNITHADLCIVVGDKTSSNSNKLVTVAKSAGINSILIDDHNDLKNIDLTKYNKVAVTSGASTPDFIVDSVIEYLKK